MTVFLVVEIAMQLEFRLHGGLRQLCTNIVQSYDN